MIPVSKSALSDNVMLDGAQAALSDNPTYLRIKEALGSRDFAWLSRETGIATSTLGDIRKGKVTRVDRAVQIASVLGRSVEWLFAGIGEDAVIDTADAEFVGLPRYDLLELGEEGKGNKLETIPLRKDWLYRRLLTSSGLWITELPTSYDELGLAEGDAIICSDIDRSAGPADNTLCILLGEGSPFVARYRHRFVYETGNDAGPRVDAKVLANENVQAIARIHARLLARI